MTRFYPPAGAKDEIVLRLNTPAELFALTASDMFSESGRLLSGMDELAQELAARRLATGLRATIFLPEDQIQPDTEMRVRPGIQRYCRLRLQKNEAERRMEWRDVLASFAVGLVMFAFGFLLSYYFNRSTLSRFTKLLVGDGVFVVIAWVGLWYPLDELVHYSRRLLREKKVLNAIATMPVSIKAASHS
ncbi:MAG: hypothetical protein M3T49_00640 [Candidatus Eremiobacteraeota bacterium]|nr:hypothetical protein [Candidatus Eremiobacteraeota bacterium]